jgi:hypothetical protein
MLLERSEYDARLANFLDWEVSTTSPPQRWSDNSDDLYHRHGADNRPIADGITASRHHHVERQHRSTGVKYDTRRFCQRRARHHAPDDGVADAGAAASSRLLPDRAQPRRFAASSRSPFNLPATRHGWLSCCRYSLRPGRRRIGFRRNLIFRWPAGLRHPDRLADRLGLLLHVLTQATPGDRPAPPERSWWNFSYFFGRLDSVPGVVGASGGWVL